jgi:hypothetical protein
MLQSAITTWDLEKVPCYLEYTISRATDSSITSAYPTGYREVPIPSCGSRTVAEGSASSAFILCNPGREYLLYNLGP